MNRLPLTSRAGSLVFETCVWFYSVHKWLRYVVSPESNRKNGLMKGKCVTLDGDVPSNVWWWISGNTWNPLWEKRHPFTRDDSRKRNWMPDGRIRQNIRSGITVSIVLKQDQRTGKLTRGIVKDILTNSASHPHGIKVRLVDGQVGRVQKIEE